LGRRPVPEVPALSRRLAALAAAALLAACAPSRAPRELVVVYPEGPASLLPHENNDEYSSSVLGNVFEPLVGMDGELTLAPALAESWHTPDDLTWVFTLREGARWHGGAPVRAEEVAAALEAARGDATSKRSAELSGVTTIEARGERELLIRTRAPLASLLNRLSQLPVFRRSTDPRGLPEGTGPYVIADWAPAAVRLTAREKTTPLRQLRFRVEPESARQLEMLRSGAVHLVTDLAPADARRLLVARGVRVVSRKGLLVHFLVMDCGRERSPYVKDRPNPFRDPRVRRAVALGLDRQALVAGPLEGEGEVVDQVVGPQVFGYDPELPPWPHDPAEARRLLAEAGLGAGFDVELDFSGEPRGATARAMEAVAEQLRGIGIRVGLRRQELASLVRRVETRDTSFYLMPWIATAGEFGSSAEYLLRTPGHGYGIDNGGLYSNPELDALLDRARATFRTDERLAQLRRAARTVHADVPVVPLYRPTDVYGLAEALEFAPRLDREIRGAEVRWR
jgi:peptide/nickel transport system substrate-binding protein